MGEAWRSCRPSWDENFSTFKHLRVFQNAPKMLSRGIFFESEIFAQQQNLNNMWCWLNRHSNLERKKAEGEITIIPSLPRSGTFAASNNRPKEWCHSTMCDLNQWDKRRYRGEAPLPYQNVSVEWKQISLQNLKSCSRNKNILRRIFSKRCRSRSRTLMSLVMLAIASYHSQNISKVGFNISRSVS